MVRIYPQTTNQCPNWSFENLQAWRSTTTRSTRLLENSSKFFRYITLQLAWWFFHFSSKKKKEKKTSRTGVQVVSMQYGYNSRSRKTGLKGMMWPVNGLIFFYVNFFSHKMWINEANGVMFGRAPIVSVLELICCCLFKCSIAFRCLH